MLAGQGFDPVNPHDAAAHIPYGSPWRDYMRPCIKAMLDCSAVYVLPGHTGSRGAMLECNLARILDIPIFDSIFELAIARDSIIEAMR
jgi:hypothetical protein